MRWAGKLFHPAEKSKVSVEKRRLAILGAGPIGLEAALHALRDGFRVTIYEKGEIGDHIRQWGHVRLFSPFGLNVTETGLEAIRRDHPDHVMPAPADFVAGNEFRDLYLIPLSMTQSLDPILKVKTEVLGVARPSSTRESGANAPFKILVRDDKKVERFEEADIVLDCTGTYSRHRWAGPGGLPALNERTAECQIAYGLEDILGTRKAHYAGKSVLVIGGGYSAATTVVNLAALAEEHQATWVFWLSSVSKSPPLTRVPNDPFRERDRLAAKANSLAARGDGNLEFHPQSWVEEITSHGPDKGFRVLARCAGKEKVWEIDRVIVNVGYRADAALHPELQAEPNFFIVGSKAASRDRDFLLKDGYEQVRALFDRLGRGVENQAA